VSVAAAPPLVVPVPVVAVALLPPQALSSSELITRTAIRNIHLVDLHMSTFLIAFTPGGIVEVVCEFLHSSDLKSMLDGEVP
jgi:hypothetical protein